MRIADFGLRIVALAAGAACLLALSGCVSIAEQKAMLAEGQKEYDQGNAAKSVAVLNKYFKSKPQPGTPDIPRAYYIRGLGNAKLQRRAEALSDLQEALRLSKSDELTWRTNVVLGTMYFEDGQWQEAYETLKRAAAKMPAQTPLDNVLYRLGQCCERLGRWPESREYFQRVAQQFPNSEMAPLARRRIALSVDYFSIQCGVYSRTENADSQAADLTRRGMQATVRREVRNGQNVFVVLTGRFSAYADALRALASVRKAVPDAVIWP